MEGQVLKTSQGPRSEPWSQMFLVTMSEGKTYLQSTLSTPKCPTTCHFYLFIAQWPELITWFHSNQEDQEMPSREGSRRWGGREGRLRSWHWRNTHLKHQASPLLEVHRRTHCHPAIFLLSCPPLDETWALIPFKTKASLNCSSLLLQNNSALCNPDPPTQLRLLLAKPRLCVHFETTICESLFKLLVWSQPPFSYALGVGILGPRRKSRWIILPLTQRDVIVCVKAIYTVWSLMERICTICVTYLHLIFSLQKGNNNSVLIISLWPWVWKSSAKT